MINEKLLINEIEVHWFYDPQIFPYVREVKDYTSRRKPPRSNDHETIIGYCSIPTTPRGMEHFRYFYINPTDFDDFTRVPAGEWIDPLTVSRGVAGRWTGRKLTAAQSAELDKVMGERRAIIDRRRIAARERQRRYRAHQRR